MFKIGDKVESLAGLIGHVVFAEGRYVEVDPGNGVTIEYDRSDLNLWTEPEPVETPQHDLQNMFNAPYVPQPGDRKVAMRVMKTVGEVHPMLLDGLREAMENFDALPAFDQVKAMSNHVGTPMVVFMGAAQMGDNDEMMKGIIQRTLFNNVMEGTGLVADMLIGRCKRAIAEHEEKK